MRYPLDDQIPSETDPEAGVPVGPRVATATAAPRPERIVLDGRFTRLEPLDIAKHGAQLFEASSVADGPARFAYLAVECPKTREQSDAYLTACAASADPLFYTVIDKRTGRAEGWQTLMRIDPPNRVIEIGNIYWGPKISRTAVTTEANFLFMRYAFDTLSYRRYEWKCNALNEPSRKAAERFGFTYEGHFRRSNIIKGRTRDTSWYSIIDEEWPRIKAGYEAWLSAGNIGGDGQQKQPLGAFLRSP